MTYKHRYCIPFLQYRRSSGDNTTDPITASWFKDCGSNPSSPSSLWYFGFPSGLTTRDVIHVRVGIKEPTGDTDAGFKLYFAHANSSYDAADVKETYTFDLGDTDQEAKFPVGHIKTRVNADLATASANSTAMRSWVSPATGSSNVYIHGLVAWVEKNVGGA